MMQSPLDGGSFAGAITTSSASMHHNPRTAATAGCRSPDTLGIASRFAGKNGYMLPMAWRVAMKFGLWFCNTTRYVDPQPAIALAKAAEAAGFQSLWTVEHTIVPAGYASAYPYDP